MTTTRTQDELAAERRFLLDRVVAEHRRVRPSDVGLSSTALVLYAMGEIERPRTPGKGSSRPGYRIWSGNECGHDYPHDEDDLGRCERTYAAAPPHMQAVMKPVLDEFRAWVNDGLNRYGDPSS